MLGLQKRPEQLCRFWPTWVGISTLGLKFNTWHVWSIVILWSRLLAKSGPSFDGNTRTSWEASWDEMETAVAILDSFWKAKPLPERFVVFGSSLDFSQQCRWPAVLPEPTCHWGSLGNIDVDHQVQCQALLRRNWIKNRSVLVKQEFLQIQLPNH